MELVLKQKKLLKLLSINCRYANKDIGKAIGLSEDAVRYQINKLINEEKFADFNVQFNYHMLGYDSYHVWIKLKKRTKENIMKLSKVKKVFSLNTSYGKYDLQLLFLAKTDMEKKSAV